MRTKALLCAAGLLAAGALTAAAQSNVYSLNVVGYVNVPLTNGFQLVANQMDLDGNRTNNTVAGVFSTNMPNLTRVYGYSTTSGYGIATYFSSSQTWSGGQPTVNNSLSPGAGVWVQIPGASGTSLNLTEVGNVVQGSVALPVATGFQIMSIVPPVSAGIKTGFGFPAGNLDRAYIYTPGSGYAIKTYFSSSSTWSPNEPTPNVGSAFWYQRAAANGATTWTQNFTVQ